MSKRNDYGLPKKPRRLTVLPPKKKGDTLGEAIFEKNLERMKKKSELEKKEKEGRFSPPGSI